jgi:hypothetical protein
MSNADMSFVLAGSVITAFRKVDPALKIEAPWRAMIEENRPACGNSGEPSATTLVIPSAKGAAMRYDCPVIQPGSAMT